MTDKLSFRWAYWPKPTCSPFLRCLYQLETAAGAAIKHFKAGTPYATCAPTLDWLVLSPRDKRSKESIPAGEELLRSPSDQERHLLAWAWTIGSQRGSNVRYHTGYQTRRSFQEGLYRWFSVVFVISQESSRLLNSRNDSNPSQRSSNWTILRWQVMSRELILSKRWSWLSEGLASVVTLRSEEQSLVRLTSHGFHLSPA